MVQWQGELARLQPQGSIGFEAPSPPLLAGGERLLLSDGLCPGGAVSVVNKLARNAASRALIEILAPEELEPPRRWAPSNSTMWRARSGKFAGCRRLRRLSKTSRRSPSVLGQRPRRPWTWGDSPAQR